MSMAMVSGPTPRDGCVGAGQLEGFGMNVAYDGGPALGEGRFAFGVAGKVEIEFFTGSNAVDADVDDGCSGLDHLRGDEAGRPMAQRGCRPGG